MNEKIAVIGAGSWGSSLARYLGKMGKPVSLWCYDRESYESIKNSGENTPFLPGYRFTDNVEPTMDFARAAEDCGILLWVVPTQFIRNIITEKGGMIPENAVIVSASKGIEKDTCLTPTGIIAEGAGRNHGIGALTGPSFAKEVAGGHPTAVIVAFEDIDTALAVQESLSSPVFRIYATADVTGAELGGALKNVVAIASGIVKGMGYGHNTTAALITRGLTEITRLGIHLGAHPETLAGLAGMGDLVLTCTGGLSRNLTVGKRLGQGEKLDDIIRSMNMVAEGVKTAKSAHELSRREGVEMPITSEVCQVLYENKDPGEALEALMTREPKQEGILYGRGKDEH